MRLAISNIAWDVSEDDTVSQLLTRYGIDAIDIAPGKYFPEPAMADDASIIKVGDWWKKRGIEITGMQALLFGTKGLNVFGSAEVQEALLGHLSAVCRIASVLGSRRLVFGSPRNRDRSGLTDDQAMKTAKDFFLRLGDIAQERGLVICLEPNPVSYGANFMTTSPETAKVVRHIDHSAIKMQFDTGALTINKEEPELILKENAPIIGHVHASEPDLVPLGDGGCDHRVISDVLKKYLPDALVSIEMVATGAEPHILSIERALAKAIENYRRT